VNLIILALKDLAKNVNRINLLNSAMLRFIAIPGSMLRLKAGGWVGFSLCNRRG